MRYPANVVVAVTEPATGIPAKLKWLPSIAEIVEECDARMPSQIVHKRHELLAAPEMDRSCRPSLDELKAKYGPTWGLKGFQ